jgi:hypothetical protein
MRTNAIAACLLAGVLLWGCSSTPPAAECIDNDGDGYGAGCANGPDCDDANAAVHPGASEVCNGLDDNCDGVKDEGCASPPDAGTSRPDAGTPTPDGGPGTPDGGLGTPDGGPVACQPGDPPVPCGVTGSTCERTCRSDGTLGPCLPRGVSTVDLMNDIHNCGECGNVCPTPLHADPRCVYGHCRRGPCAAAWFDFDRDTTYGCEASCHGLTCTLGSGETVTLTAEPLPETGLTWQAVASGSSFGGEVQTSATHTNFGILGEPTPPLESGLVESSSATHRNLGGFTTMLRKP